MRCFRALVATLSSPVVFCSLTLQDAQGDVYAWEDKAGRVIFSDVPPPAGARVLETVTESPARDRGPAPSASPRETAQEREVSNLSERVRQLEREVELANAPAGSVELYGSVPPPPLDVRCTGTWADCWWWRNQPFYGPSQYAPAFGAVIVPSQGFGRFHRFRGMRFAPGVARQR